MVLMNQMIKKENKMQVREEPDFDSKASIPNPNLNPKPLTLTLNLNPNPTMGCQDGDLKRMTLVFESLTRKAGATTLCDAFCGG